jgi:heat shock protein HtpX
VASVAGAGLLLLLGLSFVVTLIGFKFGPMPVFRTVGATHGLVLLLPLSIAALWIARQIGRAEVTQHLSRSIAEEPPADHPLRIALARLAALADMPVPPLRIVRSGRPNSYVVVEPDGVECLCVTTAALELCSPAELDAMLAHELFHIAHGDARLTGRLEAMAELAHAKVPLLADPIVGSVRRLMRQRELSADRAAALLTGRPSDLDSAIRTCGQEGATGPGDLRLAVAVPFVQTEAIWPPEHRTHPDADERAQSLARVAAQLGQ